MKKLIACLIIMCSCSAQAEVYRWTDANGKVHYTDQKPKDKAEDVTEKVKKQNIDTSTEEQKKMESIFRKENDADRQYKLEQSQPKPEDIQHCNNAKEYLRKISGAVQFIDDNGKPVNVSEVERRARVEKMRAYIQDNCSNN